MAQIHLPWVNGKHKVFFYFRGYAICCTYLLSHAQIFVTPWTVAHQAPLSMGILRQEYWSGLLCPPPEDLPNPGIQPRSLSLQVDSLLSEPQGSLVYVESVHKLLGLSKSSVVKNLPANTGDAGSIPGSRRSPGEGSGHPLQYSCLEHPRDRGSWWATVHGVAKSLTQLSTTIT